MMRADAGEELDPPDGLDDGVDKEQLSVRYAVSKVDRVLAGLAKGPMEDVERAVLDVLAGKDVVEPESDEE